MHFAIFKLLKKLTGLSSTSVEEKKKRLLRAGCLLWASIILIYTFRFVVLMGRRDIFELTFNSFILISLASILYIERKNMVRLARQIFMLLLFINLLISAYMITLGHDVELFFIIFAPLSVLFLDNQKFHFMALGASFMAFKIPADILEIHTPIHESFTINMIFFVLFFIVKDIDHVNRINESLLNKEKEKVKDDKLIIEQQHKELNELSRFKNKFFVNLSHEIRTPLTLITGALNKLNRKNDDDNMVQNALKNTQHIARLVDDVIDLSKMEESRIALNKSILSLNTFLEQQHNMFSSLFEQKKIKFTLSIPPQTIEVDVDRVYFERALHNLINNAYKYTPERGEVTIGLEISDKKSVIFVKDTGIGIETEAQHLIFKRFEQVDNEINKTGGSGIGLSFSKQVIEAHGGQLHVNSIFSKGSIFTIELNREKTKKELQPIPVTQKPIQNGKFKLFIIDDNVEIRNYLGELFENYTCYFFENGKQAFEAIQNNQPHCIITDYMMPIMNGLDFIKALCTAKIKTPTIMLTARTDEKAKFEILRLGIDDYVTKPFNEEELKIKVKNLIQNHEDRKSFEANIKKEVVDRDQKEEIEFIQQLNTVIQSEISTSTFDIKQLAENLNVSERTLHRKVKLATGLTPNQYIRFLKLNKARVLIESGEYNTLKEIALSIGMSNQSYFADLYEKQFGKRP